MASFERQKGTFTVLGIETSCDDTCVSVLDCHKESMIAPTLLHSGIARSLNENEQYGGIHPIIALQSHERHMDSLVAEAIAKVKEQDVDIDLISVTKGPGMRSSLQVGITAAEKLAAELQLPVIGVHHMQAHALTPRLLESGPSPDFPYMSLLVSGGHTLLLISESVTKHEIIASSIDIAIGDCIDKIAKELHVPWHGLMPGAALEVWCRDTEQSTPDRYVPISITDDQRRLYNIKRPLHAKVNVGGVRTDRMDFSFSGLGSIISRILNMSELTLSDADRRGLGGEAMKVCFEHVTEKVVAGLKLTTPTPSTLVVSGGVARNALLRQILAQGLRNAKLDHVRLICPPLDLCSDNATMIAWAAFEMFMQGHHEHLYHPTLRTFNTAVKSTSNTVNDPSSSTAADPASAPMTSSHTPSVSTNIAGHIVPRPKWPLNDILVADEQEFQARLAKRDKKQLHLPAKEAKVKFLKTNTQRKIRVKPAQIQATDD